MCHSESAAADEESPHLAAQSLSSVTVTMASFPLTRWRWGRINFLWDWLKFLLHFFFVRSIITDCRNEGEASVKATSWL